LCIPLHGATVIARAISLLGPRVDVRFSMIGQGPERALTEATVGADDRVRWVDWLPRGDARPLADLILKLAQNPDEVAEARRRTRKLAEGFTPFMTTSALHDRLSKLHSETIASPELYLYQMTSRSRAMRVSSRSGSSPESARVHSRQCHEMQGSLRKCMSTVPGAS